MNKKEQWDSIESSDTAAYFYIENKLQDFGTIRKNKKESVIVNFEFKNTGQKSLVIIKATPSCSCMQTEIPTIPIIPGEIGIIRVKVNLRNEVGKFNKNLIVKSNAENNAVLLRIKGIVK